MRITTLALVFICIGICLLPVLIYLLIRLRARSNEVLRLTEQAAEREELDRREMIERDRAITERIDNIALRREEERVRSILSPNTLVLNI